MCDTSLDIFTKFHSSKAVIMKLLLSLFYVAVCVVIIMIYFTAVTGAFYSKCFVLILCKNKKIFLNKVLAIIIAEPGRNEKKKNKMIFIGQIYYIRNNKCLNFQEMWKYK